MDGVGTVWNDRSGWTSQVEVSCSVNLARQRKKGTRYGEKRTLLFVLFCSFVFFFFFFFWSRGVATPQGFFVFLMKLSGRNRNGNKGDRALRGGSVRARKKV